jgi:glycosyltransferase involved in cell wall biosynthesis
MWSIGMRSKIEFSVLMPIYYKENPEYFNTALESVVNQTLMPNEIVIVKDGALTKELDAVIEKYVSKYPQLFNIVALEENVGQGKARNAGLMACKHNIVALMDSDDIAINNRFEIQIKYMEQNPDVDVVGSFITEFENDPNVIESIKAVPLTHEAIYNFGKWRSPMNNMTVIYKKDKVFEVGAYNSFNFGEDYLLFAKMLMNGCKFYNFEECLVNARAGSRMLAKRVGWNKIKQEFLLFYEFRKMGYINNYQFVRNVSLKFLLRVIPNWLRSWIYRRFLRG